MNKDHFDVRKGLGSLTKKKTHGEGKSGDRRGNPADSQREVKGGQPPRRVSPFPGIPVMRQTVIAVFVCCIVFLAVGFALFSSTQKEISNLKNDLKAYTVDGVVSAGSVDDTVSLCIEAIGARVDMMESVMENASDGTMNNSDFQWFGSELAAVKAEAETLGDILDQVDAGDDAEKAFNDEIQEPLATMQTAYAELEVSDDDMASTNLGDDGAATDTGSFKLQTGVKGVLKWIVIVVILIVLALLIFLFRKKIGIIFGRLFGEKGIKKDKRGKRKRDRHPVEGTPVDSRNKAVAEGEETAPQATDEKTQRRTFAFEEQPREAADTAPAGEKEVDPLDLLAPSFRKMAELEKAKAAQEEETPVAKRIVAEEDLMAFDPDVDRQSDIDDAEDPLFSKGEED